MCGELPPADIDHINGDRTDNRWNNLRAATRSQNLMNRKPNKGRANKNVYFQPKSGHYRVKVKYEGRTLHGGYYTKEESAIEAAETLTRQLHGEWAKAAQVAESSVRSVARME